jgi:hypothetical protein
MSSTAAAFQINAYYNSYKGEAAPSHLRVRAEVANVEIAEAIAAQFPKSYRVFVNTGKEYGTGRTYALVTIDVTLESNGNNGGKNETGIKRYRAFVAKAIKNGHTVEFAVDRATNAYQTADALHAAIA